MFGPNTCGRRTAWSLVCLAILTSGAAAQSVERTELPPVNPNPYDASKFPLQQWHPDIDAPVAKPAHPPIDKVPPMPMVSPDQAFRNPLGDNTITLYDAETGEMRVLPIGEGDPLGQGKSLRPWTGVGGFDPGMEMQRGMGSMTAVSDATLETYPARANVRLLMRFLRDNGNSAYFVCSGSMTDQGVVLTAAHCVYNRDADIGDWAEEIWIYPAWDGVGNSQPDSDDEIQAWGWARGTSYIAGSDYVNNGNWDRDCAAIAITRTGTGNRSVGELTGQYGWSYGYCDTGVTHYNYSYPSEDCSATLHTGRQMYFWDGTPDGCPGIIHGNQYDLDTSTGCFTAVWGGMSGSAIYRFIDSSRHVGAVCSTSNRSTDANYCALWEQFTTDLEAFKTTRRTNTFDIEALMFRTSGGTTVAQGSQLAASTVRIVNATNGNPGSATYNVDVYLSSNNDISTSDTLLASYNYTLDFGTQEGRTFNVPAVTIPYGTPPGTYWVGVVIDSTEDTNDTNSDTDTWDAQRITVSCLNLAAPTSVIATNNVYCDRVRLTWNAVAGASQYFIYRNTVNNSGTATLLATDTASPYDDFTASAAGTLYYYWIKADSNCDTSDFSASANGERQTAVGTPTGVSATDGAACDSVTISWTAVSNADDYYIYRNTSNSTVGATLLGSDTASPYVDATGNAGQVYYYFVRAGNACGTGSYSASNSGYGSILPTAPTGVSASDGSSCTSVSVSWTAVSGADSYAIYRNTSNTTVGATLLGTDNASPYTDATAVAGTTYFYWVRATNECGTGGYSASNSGYRNTPPTNAPTGVSASDGTTCTPTITVTWNAVGNATGYRVLRNTVNNLGTATQIATNVFSPYDDVTAVANTTYFYWVGAVNACGNGPVGIPDQGNRGTAAAPPTGLAATDGTRCNSVVLSWTAAPGATGYQVFRNTVNNSGTAVQIGTDTASPYVDNTVVGATVYFYWLRSTNTCGTSGFSTTNSGFGGTGIVIDQQPVDLTVVEGQEAQFSIDVGGASGYQWRRNNVPLANGPNMSGVNTDTLTIFAASEADEGSYTCFVTSTCGNVLSSPGVLTVNPQPCPADYNQDGGIDGADVDAFFADWENGLPAADVNFDGGVDGADVDYFFLVWEAGGCF